MRDQEHHQLIQKAQTILIKVGTSILTDEKGRLDLKIFQKLARQIVYLKNNKKKVALVSSGAIASGLHQLGYQHRPQQIVDLQACAAVGQPTLFHHYEKAFSRHKVSLAQILITREDLENRRRYINAKNTLQALLNRNVLPIINENDTVMVEEIKVGDNDNLAALMTNLVEADLLIILTDCDGLYTEDPRVHKDAKLISLIQHAEKYSFEKSLKTATRMTTIGGMETKIKAVQTATHFGVPSIIANGHDPHVIKKIMEGSNTGTLFLSDQTPLAARKHWIGYVLKANGSVTVDAGAAEALIDGKKSLLPSGIISIQGSFGMGDVVNIMNLEGKKIGCGIVTYNAEELNKIKKTKSSDIQKILGYKYTDEAIHRDDLVIL